MEKYEQRLGLREPWLPTSKEYQQVLQYIDTRKFRRALDKLQFLVIQRLLELEKAHSSGLSYGLCSKLSKALAKREDGIKTALTTYNTLAARMNPPAPLLHKDDVLAYTYMGEFDLLKFSYSRADILEKEWCQPANRQIAMKHFKIQRAHEEIKRVNIEVRRLLTSIRDENKSLRDHVVTLRLCDPLLAEEIERYRQHRLRLNGINLLWIHKIQNIPGYTGHSSPGKKADNSSNTMSTQMPMGSPLDLQTHGIVETVETAASEFQDMMGIEAEDLSLLHNEMQNERTEEDLIADDQQNARVAEVVELLHVIAEKPPPVKSRNRLRDVVPGAMMSRFRI